MMRILFNIAFALWVVAVVVYVVDLVLLIKYCKAGFMGYPDVWSSKKAERAHYILAPVSFGMIIVSGLIAFLITLTLEAQPCA